MTRLWERFDRIVVFDTETTGVEFGRDRIIEIGAVALEGGAETDGMDLFLRLPEGWRLDPFITRLTGITEERLEAEGVGDEEAAKAFAAFLEGSERPLIAAYNAQFDLNFLFFLLQPWGLGGVLKAPRFLDVMTVYRDRRDHPHKLCDAIEAYHLEDKALTATEASTTPGRRRCCWRPWRRRRTIWSGTSTSSACIRGTGGPDGRSPR